MIKNGFQLTLKFTAVLIIMGMSLQSMGMEHHIPNGLPMNKIRNAHKIAFYTGAFDPIHNGHNEVMEAALKDHNLDLLFVSPDPDGNNYKPYISNRHIRLMMLKRTYEFHPNVIPCLMTKEGVADILHCNPTAQIFGIVGSDNILLKLSEQQQFNHPLGHPKVLGYLVHVRENEYIDFPIAKAFFKKKIIPLSIIKYPNLSSTKIRNQILNARDKNISIKEIDLSVPQSIQDFITEFNPYKNMPNPPNKFTLMGVKSIIMMALECDLSLIIPLQRGFSGDLIYSINKDEGKFIAKILIGINRNKELQDIRGMSIILDSLELQTANFVKPIKSIQTGSFNIVIFPFISGRTVLDHLMNEPLSLPLATKIGRALSELNTKKAIPCSEQGLKAITAYYEKLKGYMNIIKEQLPDLFLSYESVRSEVDELYDNFLKDPGFMGHNHGDASPTNLIIPKEGELYFIDYTGCAKTLDQQENPFGFPAHDLYQFISGIHFHLDMRNARSNNDSISLFTRTVKESYLKHARPYLTQASLDFFEGYYYARLLISSRMSGSKL